MSTIKISQLTELTQLNSNTSNTFFVGVDIPSGVTGKLTGTALSQRLYSNNPLIVGQNLNLFPYTIGQLSGSSPTYLQINSQNFNSFGSGDYIVTTDTGNNSFGYIDFGINNSQFSDQTYSSMDAYDGYIYVSGISANSFSGNLVVGTASANANIVFIAGGTTKEKVVANYTNSSINFYKKIYLNDILVFADGTTQNTSAATLGYSQASFALANSVNTFARTANTTLQTNINTVNTYINTVNSYSYSSNTWLKNYTDNSVATALTVANSNLTIANSNLQTNINVVNTYINAVNLYSYSSNVWLQNYTNTSNVWLKNYTDNSVATALNIANSNLSSTNTWIRNNYLANSTGVFSGTLTVTEDIISNNVHTNNVYINGVSFNSSGLIKTPNGTNSQKDLIIKSGNDLGGYTGGSISITSGDSTALNGIAGNISLTAGKGNTSNGFIFANGDFVATSTISLKNSNIVGNTPFLIVTGAANNAYQNPTNPGYTVFTTSIDDSGNRIVADSFGSGANNYSAFIGRRGRGTAQSPSALVSGDIIARFGGNGWGSTKFSQYGDARIEMVAAENFSDSSKRTKIDFYTTTTGSNVATKIATFNGDQADFTGIVNPQKGFVYTPNVVSQNVSSYSIDVANNSLYKFSCNTDLSFALTNFQQGKVVEVWVTNLSNSTRTLTHGCSSLSSTVNATTVSVPATSSIYLRYFSVGTDLANTFVSITH